MLISEFKDEMMQKYQTATARILLALVFLGTVIVLVLNIMNTPGGYLQYQMTLGQLGLPSIFAPVIILIKFICGFALLIGFKTKINAYILATFAIFNALVIGTSASPNAVEVFFTYFGLAGGLLLLAQYPQTSCCIDNLKK
jgi:putative oxidoreductase